MLVTLLAKSRNKDCKTTELGLLLQTLPVRIVPFVETLGSHLKAPKPCEVLQRFFANLNGSMKLLRSERPGISFFAKVVQLLALKCGTGLMFPEKNCCIHRPRRIEAV